MIIAIIASPGEPRAEPVLTPPRPFQWTGRQQALAGLFEFLRDWWTRPRPPGSFPTGRPVPEQVTFWAIHTCGRGWSLRKPR